MLDLIARTDNFELPRKLKKTYFPEVKSPLINFVEMMPDVIDT